MNTHANPPTTHLALNIPAQLKTQVQASVLNTEEIVKCDSNRRERSYCFICTSRTEHKAQQPGEQDAMQIQPTNLNCPEFSSMTESGARASALPHKDEHNTYSLSFSFPKHHRTYCCFEGFWLSSQGTQSDQMQHSVLASGLIQRL